ncbi:AAA-associated domain-containing protein [Candidatus Micrarchaeota archaeon]|nr:AAA-associated domain-containing protein [Candidatus Micrarchaeota archaeon]
MVKHKTLPFPDANVGEVLGLVEMIYAYGGKSKISFIAEELRLQLDDLGDVVDMAEVLSLVKVKAGVVQLTVYGEALNLGTIEDKKRILRKQISEIEPFKTIVEILKVQKTITRKEIIQKLKGTNIIEDENRFHKLLLSWGGYSEIFEYEGAKQTFRLPVRTEEPGLSEEQEEE